VPTDPYERAQVLQWMFFEQYDHEPAIAVVRFWLVYSGRPEAFTERLEERTAAGYRALDALERGLDGRNWLVGDAMTLADIALLRVHARRARRRLRSRPLPRNPCVARTSRVGAGARLDRRVTRAGSGPSFAT